MNENDIVSPMKALEEKCHQASYDAGWWHHCGTGYPYIPGDNGRVSDGNGGIIIVPWLQLPPLARQMITHYWPMQIACKFALIHSEISEGLEAHRKDLKDDKLCHRLGLETEIADAFIRQFDLTGAMNRAASLGVVDPGTHGLNIGRVIIEKMDFNATRPDHKPNIRQDIGGKKY